MYLDVLTFVKDSYSLTKNTIAAKVTSSLIFQADHFGSLAIAYIAKNIVLLPHISSVEEKTR